MLCELEERAEVSSTLMPFDGILCARLLKATAKVQKIFDIHHFSPQKMQIIISKCLLETYCGFYQHVNIKIISCLSSLLEKWGKVGQKYSVLLFLFRLLK